MHLIIHQDFMNLYKNILQNHNFFLVTDATPATENSSCSRKNLLERIEKLIMITDDKITDGKTI